MPDYIDLRGHQVYSYEWENNGEAVLLLHGGLSQTSHWDYVLTPDLEPDFHLFAYDRTGHGYTGDREGSFHFDYQIKEAIAYLEDIVKERTFNIIKTNEKLEQEVDDRRVAEEERHGPARQVACPRTLRISNARCRAERRRLIRAPFNICASAGCRCSPATTLRPPVRGRARHWLDEWRPCGATAS